MPTEVWTFRILPRELHRHCLFHVWDWNITTPFGCFPSCFHSVSVRKDTSLPTPGMGVQLVSGPDTSPDQPQDPNATIPDGAVSPPVLSTLLPPRPRHAVCHQSHSPQGGLLEGASAGRFTAAASVQEIAKPRKPKGRCCIVTPHPQWVVVCPGWGPRWSRYTGKGIAGIGAVRTETKLVTYTSVLN